MLNINKFNYSCNPEDYKLTHIQEFCNLKIYKKVGELERYIGLLNDLTDIFPNTSQKYLFIFGIKYSSFIAHNCVSKFNTIYIVNVSNDYDQDYENTLINIDEIKTQNPNANISIVSLEFAKSFINKDSILFFYDDYTQFIHENINNQKPLILCHEFKEYIDLYDYNYKLTNSEYHLYVPFSRNIEFLHEFFYYLPDIINNTDINQLAKLKKINLNYNNLIHLCIMVKNGGNDFREMLIKNLPIIDRWTILDTGSTDDTIKNINEILVGKKKGNLYQEPFINFRESRNRCLELSGYNCKYRLMLDDTYVIEGRLREFLEICRGDQFADSYSLLVKSGDTSYYSNRITKSLNNLKYIYTIHEVIQKDNNVNVVIPSNWSSILDMRSDYMEKRTMDRKKYDLEQLFLMMEEYPDDPRHLYYIAQTYNLLEDYENSTEYFKKRAFHPVQGFDQERVDALFEMTRTYNFKLNKPWEECEKYYKLVHEWDPERPEASYFIGIHYYLENNFPVAFEYFKQAFKIGFPIHRQYSLKPTLSYHFLPKFLAKLCYQFDDYNLGYEVTSLFIQHNKPEDDEYDNMVSFHGIFGMLKKSFPTKIPAIVPPQKVFCFVADGGFKQWSGSSIIKEGVGGSETYIIEMSKYIKKNSSYEVVVFCNCPQAEIYEGVKYLHLSEFFKYVSEMEFEHCVISRFSEYIPVAIRGHAKNIHLVAHDLTMSGNVLPVHPKIKNILCLTDWHKRYFLERFNQFKDITYGFHYGIDFTHFQYRNEPKIKNSFIYSSFPNRGLIVILNMWPRIITRYPDATLNLFCDMGNKWSNDNFPQEMQTIKQLLEMLKPYGVVNHGWVDKPTLGKFWRQSRVWFYPCKFKETFCLTALECALSKTFAITNNLASLEDTVGDRGIRLDCDEFTVLNQEWQNKAFDVICAYLDQPQEMTDYIERNYEWAMEHSWEQRAIEFLKIVSIDEVKSSQLENKTKDCYIENMGQITCYENEFMSNKLQEEKDWEPELNSYYSKYLTDETIAIDVGACIGLNTLKMAKLAKTVYSFEPYLQSFELLNKNIDNNHVKNVKTFNYGLGDKEEHIDTMWFGFYGNKPNIGMMRINQLYGCVQQEVKVNFDVKRLDDVFSNSEEKIGLIKIDVEGYEKNVINGAMEIIKKHKPVIIVENWNDYEYKELLELGYVKHVEKENTIFVFQSNAYKFDDNININELKTIANNFNNQSLLNNLNYADMYNWTNDLPTGQQKIFESVLDLIKRNNSNRVLEIGTFAGTSLINILHRLPGSSGVAIDRWENYDEKYEQKTIDILKKIQTNNIEQIYRNNLKIANMESRVETLKGDSIEKLCELLVQKREFDFIYVDGSHRSYDCFADCILSWKLLAKDGIMAIDDYLYKTQEILTPEKERPFEGVNEFLEKYKGQYHVIDKNYRVFIRKL